MARGRGRCRRRSRRCWSAPRPRSRRRATSAGAPSSRRWSAAIFIQIGTNLANDYSDAKRGADTDDRLGPVRVTSSGLVAPRRVLVATWLAFAVAVAAGHLPGDRRRPGDPRRRRRLDPRRRPLHRRPAALRLRGHGRAVRLPLLRPGRRQRLLLRPARGARLAAVRALDRRSASSRRRSSSSTTSATSRPTAAPARAPSRCGSGASGRAASTRLLVVGAFVVAADHPARGRRARLGPARRSPPRRSPPARSRGADAHRRARR